MSDDGRYVLFTSRASNLTEDDVRTGPQVYLRDMELSTTTLVSKNLSGEPSLAAGAADLAPDGSVAYFSSCAPDLIPGDEGLSCDHFAYEISTGRIERVADNTTFGFVTSSDGAYLAASVNTDPGGFEELALLVRHRPTGTDTLIRGQITPVRISDDGRYVVYNRFTTTNDVGYTVGVFDVATQQIAEVEGFRAGGNGSGRIVIFTRNEGYDEASLSFTAGLYAWNLDLQTEWTPTN
ncbi:MAG: hypothetical protein AAFZ07_23335 [Actinomycetota bacterium]